MDEARHSLLMSAYWKIPLQALVLLLGVFVFVFHVFNTPPLIFSGAASSGCGATRRTPMPPSGRTTTPRLPPGGRQAARRVAASPDDSAREAVRTTTGRVQQMRSRARDLVRQTTGDPPSTT